MFLYKYFKYKYSIDEGLLIVQTIVVFVQCDVFAGGRVFVTGIPNTARAKCVIDVL